MVGVGDMKEKSEEIKQLMEEEVGGDGMVHLKIECRGSLGKYR